MSFWLIQRGVFQDLTKSYNTLTGYEGLIDLDYMGAAEFEWGAIPRSYRRIFYQYERGQYIFHYINDIRDVNGKILVIFCRRDRAEAIEKEIRKMIEMGGKYRLKEWCPILGHIRGDEYRMTRDFFWCVDWEYDEDEMLGDWMGWFGMNKLTPFKTAFLADYNNWWLAKSEADREMLWRTAQKGWHN